MNNGDQELAKARSFKDRISLRNLRTFSSLKNRDFRLYFNNSVCVLAAVNMQVVVRSLLVYRLTDSATILGVVSLANFLPMLFLSLFGGVIADRIQKKYVILFGQLGSALISLVIALTLTTGYLSAENAGAARRAGGTGKVVGGFVLNDPLPVP